MKIIVTTLGILLLFSCSGKKTEMKTAEEYVALAKKGSSEKRRLGLLDSALIVDSTCSDAYIQKGVIYRLIGKPDSSFFWYNKALTQGSAKTDSYKAIIHAELSLLYLTLRDEENILGEINKPHRRFVWVPTTFSVWYTITYG